MLRSRVIPCLLLKGAGLVKTRRFSDPTYVGDPINAVRIFNDKEVDELIFLDILATEQSREPNYPLIADIASECFMPLCVGGGIHRLDQIERIFKTGVEKVSLNSVAFEEPEFIRQAAKCFGSQSIVASIDVRRTIFGAYRVVARRSKKTAPVNLLEWARRLEDLGAGEILLNAVDRDGMMGGYDLDLIRQVSNAVSIPVIACGGAGQVAHLKDAILSGASAAAAGSLFVFHGKHRAVLINFPSASELQSEELFSRHDRQPFAA